MNKLSNDIRELTCDEMELVTGGYLDHCTDLRPITVMTPPTSNPGQHDPFSKYTIGQY